MGRQWRLSAVKRLPMLGSVGRQWRLSAVKRLPTLSATAVAVWALVGCGGSGPVVVDAEGGDEQVQVQEIDGESSGAEQEVMTVGTEAPALGDTEQSGTEASVPASAEIDVDDSGALSPEGLSTGPVLQWTEWEFPFDVDYVHAMESSAGGRIVVVGGPLPTAVQAFVSDDTTSWTPVVLPEGIFPFSLDLSGPRWALAGWPTGGPLESERSDDNVSLPVFISDDQGLTWDEVTFRAASRDPELPEHASLTPGVVTVYTSGERVVAAVQSFVEFDQSALSPEQQQLVDDREIDTRLRLFAGNGVELTETGSFKGWAAGGAATTDGFVLLLRTDDGLELLTSHDGSVWSTEPLAGGQAGEFPGTYAFADDGTVWGAVPHAEGTRIERIRRGETASASALLGGLDAVIRLSTGPPGLAALAWPSLDSDVSNANIVPSGRLAKDGYELRFNEPVGGLTLWDLTADAAVYVFDAEDLASTTAPEGVREQDGASSDITFVDPDTGEDLVTFTFEKIDEAVGLPSGDDIDAPEYWVGWSADGTEWGWESTRDAFGLDGGEVNVNIAVGGDFVIAMVQTFDYIETTTETSDGATVVESRQAGPPSVRWFIARVP
ncbi:hypothetical protein [Candidatus Poriferisodalis sp.]|uniref:hypothetical protein n=1 Tax=Candidatus Poriferisodalis sp. TaxID=3101277 RepID=UPI003C6EAE02